MPASLNLHSEKGIAAKSGTPLIEARGLEVNFQSRSATAWSKPGVVSAVDGVDLTIEPGECLGIVGESGCGKSTLARVLIGLQTPTAGTVSFDGMPVAQLGRGRFRVMQLIFQDPLSSLNPRMTIGDIIAEPIRNFRPETGSQARAAETASMLQRVGLTTSHYRRYPHELSGGQRQRVAIARALAAHPRLLICDEPLSALDASIQAQIINLLKELKETLGLTIVFISHDLAAVRHLSERVLVMYRGKVMELAARDALFKTPAHPYTRRLLAAVSRRVADAPEAEHPSASPAAPTGCVYRTRCAQAQALCNERIPALSPFNGRQVACHFPIADAS